MRRTLWLCWTALLLCAVGSAVAAPKPHAAGSRGPADSIEAAAKRSKGRVAIAVLPFGEATPRGKARTEDALLKDALARALSTALARVPWLRVTERTKPAPGEESGIGSQVEASWVVVGSFYRSENVMRVTCRLANVRTASVDVKHVVSIRRRVDGQGDLLKLPDAVADAMLHTFPR